MKFARCVSAMAILVVGATAVAQADSRSACTQTDVLAFVNKARQAQSLDAVRIDRFAVREIRLPARYPQNPYNLNTALCSTWALSRNPAWQPDGEQPRTIRLPLYYRVSKLKLGYEVSLVAAGRYQPGAVPP